MLKLGVIVLSLSCLAITNCQDVTQYSGDILPSFISLISDILPDYLNNTAIVSLAVNTMLATSDLVFDYYLPPPELPVLAEDIWWGDDCLEEDTSIREFKIQFDETKIQRLVNKINNRETLTESLINSDSSYGLDIDVLNDFVDKWANEYDFEGRQNILSRYPQFMTQGSSKIGFASHQIAIIFKKIMTRIGHDKFYMHAGDLGQTICTDLMTIYPDNVLGYHTNFGFSLMPKTLVKRAIGSLYPPSVVEKQYKNRMYPLSSILYNVMNSFGYFHEQATKPDTVGAAITYSPTGLASWVGTLYYGAARNATYDGIARIFGIYNVTDIYDVLTIYWDSESITTAMRYYAEWSGWFQDPNQWSIIRTPTKTPFAITKVLNEIIYMSDEFLMDKYPNLVYSNTMDYGTQFFSNEQPEIFSNIIRDAVKSMIAFNNSV